MDYTPKTPEFIVPDSIEPDLCDRCSVSQETEHRPCFAVGCYCHCSLVKGWIA